MPTLETSPQPKQIKRYAATISVPSVKADIFRDVARGRRIARISRTYRAECAAIERIIADGIREMRQTSNLPRFRCVDGFGRPMGRAVIAMPRRESGVAA